MTSIDAVAHKYRALNCGHLANGLAALLGAAEANALSYLDLVEQLVDLELQGRETNRLAANLRKAGFPVIKRLEEFDYRHQTTITKRQVNQLLDFRFLEERANLVFIGPPGVGKTHLAVGIGLKALEAGYKVLFTTALALVETLELAELRGSSRRRSPACSSSTC
jgi:DNA replication protein DnaC